MALRTCFKGRYSLYRGRINLRVSSHLVFFVFLFLTCSTTSVGLLTQLLSVLTMHMSIKTHGALSDAVIKWEVCPNGTQVSFPRNSLSSDGFTEVWPDTPFSELPSTVRVPKAGPWLAFLWFIWWVISCLFSLQIKKKKSHHMFSFSWWIG